MVRGSLRLEKKKLEKADPSSNVGRTTTWGRAGKTRTT